MSRKRWITNKGIIIVLSSLLGLCGVGLIVAGTRTKKKQWKVWGWVYMAIGLAVIMIPPLEEVYAVVWIVSIVHTVRISSEYCMRLKVMQESKDVLRQKELELAKKKQEEIYEELTGVKKEKRNMENQEEVRKVRRIDVNTCTEMDLMEIPGIGLILAKRIVDIRADKKFTSVEDFYKRLNIEEDRQKVITDYLFCSEVKSVEKNVHEGIQYDHSVASQDIEKKTEERKERNSLLAGRKIDL